MAQLESVKADMEGLSAQVIYIAAEKGEGIWKPQKFLLKHPVSFPFLLDEDRSVSKAYGLYHRFGRDAINIAHPATLIAGRDRKLTYIYRGDNQNDRAPVELIVQALRNTVGI
jgi:peroxiredoxin